MEPQAFLNTVQLQAYLDRLRAGDREAADALLRRVSNRLERLVGRMLREFPNVKRWVDTSDVLQSALIRLLRTLEEVRPETPRDLINLAAVHVRRELLDLARHFRGCRQHEPTSTTEDSRGGGALSQLPANASAEADLDLWSAFHEQVELLPAEEREVVGLTFYHGWSQAEIAALLQVDERTVRRRWRSACLRLSEALSGRLPGT